MDGTLIAILANIVDAIQQQGETLHRLESKLDRVLNRTKTMTRNQEAGMSDFSQLRAEVAANRTIIEGAVTFINGLSAQLLAVRDNPGEIAAIAEELRANSKALGIALEANTPGGPVVPTLPGEILVRPVEPVEPGAFVESPVRPVDPPVEY